MTPHAIRTVLLSIFSLGVVASVILAVARMRRSDDRLIIMLGCGATGALFEGFACYLLHCKHAIDGIYEAYEAFGVHVPVWLCELYVLFFGTLPYLFQTQFDKTPTKRFFWLFFIVVGLSEALGEIYTLHLGLFTYYGAQPLPLFGYPLPLAFINPVTSLTFGWLACAWFDRISGALRYLLIPLAPALLAGLHAALTFPTSAFVYSRNTVLLPAGAIASIALCLFLGHLVQLGYTSRSKVHFTARSELEHARHVHL